jgi:hypothetical protein
MGRYLATVSLSPDSDATCMLKRVILSALFVTGAANAANKQVAILGTGLCDLYGVETVCNIAALP